MESENRLPRRRRRDVLTLGAGATAAALTGPGAMEAGPPAPASLLHTPLCDLLGIEHPLLQAPMGGVSTPAMAAAVASAGGLGILAGIGVAPEDLRRQIREVRGLTDRPFGVNLLLHAEIQRMGANAAAAPEETVQAVQRTLNRFRAELGLPARESRPAVPPDTVQASIEVIFEERVPLFSIGLGLPSAAMVKRFHDAGARVIAMACTVADAVELESTGVDAVVAQGSEAGGHRSTWIKRDRQRAAIGTFALVPQVVSRLKVPVIAAGGVMDGRGLVAALALGASGVLIGTRFIATAESGAPPMHKQSLVDGDSDATIVTDAFTGLWARMLRNRFVEEYHASAAPVLPPFVQFVAAGDIVTAAAKSGDREHYPLYAGQGVGLIEDLPAAADLVRSIVREAEQVLSSLAGRAGRR